MNRRRGLAARGALIGAIAGVAAGLVDFALALSRAGAFLPGAGMGKLALFLATLYGAAFAGALALGGAAAGLLMRFTDGEALWRAAFHGEESEGRRRAAYFAGALISLAGVGAALRQTTLVALHLYHHRLLIAALVGATGVALLAGAAILTLLLAAALSPLLRTGPRARLRFRAPPGWLAAAWVLGLEAGGAGVTFLLFRLQARGGRPAGQVGLWGPIILAGCVLAAHLIARALPLRRPALATPRGALLAVAAAVALPVAAALVASWSLARQLDLRPFVALAVAVVAVVTLLAANAGAWLVRARLPLRAAAALAVPALLLAAALAVGRLDRVRKAAVTFTGATRPIVGLIQRVADLDRDGYSSVLGGGDCADLDADIHPDALDWPDDGIDQNCNGQDATVSGPARRPFAAVPPGVPREPNVLLITLDAVRADHVGAYGYARPTTPRLDALAREATLFTDAWAHAPSTRYSIPAILTGRYPSTIASDPGKHWPPAILPENRLLAEMLKDRGYATGVTASYGGSGYFQDGWGMFQGFDETDTHLSSLHSLAGDPSNTSGTSSRELADLDIAWIDKHKGQKFFLWTHFYDTHYGFERHPDMPEASFGDAEIDLYDGEIRFTDHHVGRVLDALRAAGLWDRTIIIVTADHGDGFGEHGIPPDKRHGYHLYATETRIPLIFRVPGLPPREVHTIAGHIDIVPTLLNALGAAAGDEPTALGRSLLGRMTGAEPDDLAGEVFQEVTYEGPGSQLSGTQKRAVVDRAWHYLRNVVPDGTSELYRREDDAAEEHDRSGLGEEAERSLSERLAAWMDGIALPADFATRVAGNVARQPFAPRQPLGDTLAGSLVLDGVDAPARAGQTFEVALYLHVDAPLAGWRFFTHVVGAGGRMLNLDHEPVQGTIPVARMRPGTWLRDRIKVTLPADWPAGEVKIRVGLFKGGQRAPAAGPHAAADHAIDVATVTVTP